MPEQRHVCGGTLRPAIVRFHNRVGKLQFMANVDGLICNRCGEEVLERETALAIETASQTPQAILETDGQMVSGSSLGVDTFFISGVGDNSASVGGLMSHLVHTASSKIAESSNR